MRSVDGKLDAHTASMEEVVARTVDAAAADLTGRIASLEDTVLTLAEALLRPAICAPHTSNASHDGRS
jgi:hypothetical protein